MKLEGVHHVTAITGDAPGNVDFYARVLGLRLVKKSVNQDDPTVYHLFYGDDEGTPGNDITFFEYRNAQPGRAGAGMVHRVVWRVGSDEALSFWEERLGTEGVKTERTAEGSLRFADPEGLGHELAVRPGHTGMAELTAGFAAVIRRPALRVVIGLSAAMAFVDGLLEVLLVLIALQLLHGGNGTLGWLNVAAGIGSIAGAFFVAALAMRRKLAGGFALGLLLSSIPLAVTAAVSSLAPTLLLIGVLGVGAVFCQVNGVTLLQRSAENEVMGRVFAVLEMLILTGLAIGSIAAPGLVSWLGTRGALIASGVFVPVLVVGLWPSLRRIDAEAVIAEEPLKLLRRIEIFAQLPEPVLEGLAAGATPISVAADGVVVSRGEVGNHFYAIAAGKAAVELDDGMTRELGPGDFFGEIALLRDVPRTATVRALEPLRLFAIEREEFLTAVTGHGPTLATAEDVVVSRLPAGALAG